MPYQGTLTYQEFAQNILKSALLRDIIKNLVQRYIEKFKAVTQKI